MTEDIKSYFGLALVNVRTELGISQYRLAELSGLKENYLTLLEHGKYDPRVSTVLKISRALQIGAGVILNEQERLEDEARSAQEASSNS